MKSGSLFLASSDTHLTSALTWKRGLGKTSNTKPLKIPQTRILSPFRKVPGLQTWGHCSVFHDTSLGTWARKWVGKRWQCHWLFLRDCGGGCSLLPSWLRVCETKNSLPIWAFIMWLTFPSYHLLSWPRGGFVLSLALSEISNPIASRCTNQQLVQARNWESMATS